MRLEQSFWPADTSAPVLDLTVGGSLRQVAADRPDGVGIIEGLFGERRRWTNAEVLEVSERVAGALLERFHPGDRVAVWAPNIAEWLFVEFGAALAGMVLVTVNPAYRVAELRHVLSQSGAVGLFMVEEHRGNALSAVLDDVRADLPDLREVVLFSGWDEFLASAPEMVALPEVSPTDRAQIQYTSGTTGVSKGALLVHRGITTNASFDAEAIGLEAEDVWINPMPLFHCGGCVIAALGSLHARATHVPVLQFDPALVLDLIEQERGTVLSAVPTMLLAIMEQPDFADRDLSSLRAIVSGGSKVPPEMVRRIEGSLGARVSITYGQTEASPVITQTRLDDSLHDKAETVGRPHPQTEVKIVDPATGATVPLGQMGELCTRGYLLMEGYYEMPERTAEAVDGDGWLHTGDLCAMDERGYCSIEGRLGDMIIRGGENIYPREVEEVLHTHPDVGDVAVVGVPDERWGEEVAAFVRPVPGRDPNASELRAYVRARLAPQKAPRIWTFLEELPTTPSGKIQKFVLREAHVKKGSST